MDRAGAIAGSTAKLQRQLMAVPAGSGGSCLLYRRVPGADACCTDRFRGAAAYCPGKLWKQVQDRRVRITCAYISGLFVFKAVHMVSACSLSGTDKSRRIKVVLFSRTSQWTI